MASGLPIPGAAVGGVAALPAAPAGIVGIVGIGIVALVGCVAGPAGIALGMPEVGCVSAGGVVEGEVVVCAGV